MDCTRFENLMFESLDGLVTPADDKFMREHQNVWSKVSCPERLSLTGPKALQGEPDLAQGAYRDVVPFARRIVETFPDRVLWGTDWPHPNLKDHMPDDGLLVEFASPVAAVRTAITVQDQMADRETGPEDSRIRFRIGINLGDIIVDGDQLCVGDAASLKKLQTEIKACEEGE